MYSSLYRIYSDSKLNHSKQIKPRNAWFYSRGTRACKREQLVQYNDKVGKFLSQII